MSDYERKMEKIEDILADATQTELNHIHQFFAEAAEIEHDAEKKYTAADVARTAWLVLGGEYALHLNAATSIYIIKIFSSFSLINNCQQLFRKCIPQCFY